MTQKVTQKAIINKLVTKSLCVSINNNLIMGHQVIFVISYFFDLGETPPMGNS